MMTTGSAAPPPFDRLVRRVAELFGGSGLREQLRDDLMQQRRQHQDDLERSRRERDEVRERIMASRMELADIAYQSLQAENAVEDF